jgi:hypothetical protein
MPRSGAGSRCAAPFVVGGAEVAECGAAASVVVYGDPPEDVVAGVGLAVPVAVVDVEFSFEGGEKRFGQDVVIRRADSPRGAADTVRWQAPVKT